MSDDKDSPYYQRINLTLINVFLYWFGPMSEKRLTQCLLGLQVVCSAIAIHIRYHFGNVFNWIK